MDSDGFNSLGGGSEGDPNANYDDQTRACGEEKVTDNRRGDNRHGICIDDRKIQETATNTDVVIGG